MKLDKIVVESHGKMYVCRAKVDRKTNSVIAVSDDGSVIVTVRKLTPAERKTGSISYADNTQRSADEEEEEC